ncbi:hypothetical protein RGI145_09935 [Roseomonas gilardii]|uniref:Uncharacterized protein n=1 Tax=Roseomonas gilardii TaxID=257708 RepID=A0A1L7AEX9_9PROT|nr:hypothetical protein [Roseomonas gilardii]APT57367.1 hypothetical protein RGI145_09935 [Roseomonas gilardii]
MLGWSRVLTGVLCLSVPASVLAAPAPDAPAAIPGDAAPAGVPDVPPPTAKPGKPSLAALWNALPAEAGGFRRREVEQPSPSPEGVEGLVARYAGPSGRATVYLYGKPTETVPDGPFSPALVSELASEASYLRAELQRGEGGVRLLAQRHADLGVRGGTPVISCEAFDLQAGKKPQEQTLCMSGVAGRMLKLHLITEPKPKEEEELRRNIARFAVEMVRALHGAGRG